MSSRIQSLLVLAFGCCFCALTFPAVASAQSDGHVAGVVGATFQSQTDGVFGGEVAASVHRNVQIYGGVNLMRNVLPRNVQTNLDDLARDLTASTGIPWGFNASVRALTAVGGVRLRLPTGHTWRPYAAAGGGVARVKFKITELDLGDITTDILEELGTDKATATKPFLEFGGGVEVPIGALFLDAGYRYGRLVDDDGLNTSRVNFSVGARF